MKQFIIEARVFLLHCPDLLGQVVNKVVKPMVVFLQGTDFLFNFVNVISESVHPACAKGSLFLRQTVVLRLKDAVVIFNVAEAGLTGFQCFVHVTGDVSSLK